MASICRLLILSCSRRKRSAPDLLPAIERYDGPTFRVLRRFLRKRPNETGRLRVFVLSAAYGLISSAHPITDYNEMMTRRRATELHDEVLDTLANLLCNNDYSGLCLAMSKAYLAALEGWPTLVPSDVVVTVTDGPQGMKLAQLKRWLWGDIADGPGSKQREARPCGVACLRGVELRLMPAQVLKKAQAALVEDGTGADRFREWYVEVDGRCVAPKWLVSKLAGLPVNTFTTGEARRVLYQLGLHVRQVTETVNDHQSA